MQVLQYSKETNSGLGVQNTKNFKKPQMGFLSLPGEIVNTDLSETIHKLAIHT